MSYKVPLLAQQTGFSWEEESEFKVRPTNIDRYLRVLSHSPPVPVMEYEEVYGHGHGFEPAYVNDLKKLKCEGKFQFEVVTGEILGGIMGTVQSQDQTTYQDHTITMLQAMPPSFAVQVPYLSSAENLIMEFLGCRFNNFNFKSSEDDETLKCDADYLACIPQDGGTTEETVATTIDPPFIAKQGVFSSTALFTGARARVYGFGYKIARNLKPVYAHGNEHYPYDIVPGKASYADLELTVGLEDDTEWNEVIGPRGTIYDYEMLYTRVVNDLLKISGNAKFTGMPPEIEEHEVRATLNLVPYTATIFLEDDIALYPFE